MIPVLRKRSGPNGASCLPLLLVAVATKKLAWQASDIPESSLTDCAGEVTSKYYVVDGVEALQKFGQDAWDRVICVVTTGQAWQFKPYKWQDPKVLFRNGKCACAWFRDTIHPAWVICGPTRSRAEATYSQGHIFPVEQRADQPRHQGLERHADEGEFKWG